MNKKLTNELLKLKITSPVDKGETFKIEQAMNPDQIQKDFNQVIDNIEIDLQNEFDKKVIEIKNEVKIKLENENNTEIERRKKILNDELEERKKLLIEKVQFEKERIENESSKKHNALENQIALLNKDKEILKALENNYLKLKEENKDYIGQLTKSDEKITILVNQMRHEEANRYNDKNKKTVSEKLKEELERQGKELKSAEIGANFENTIKAELEAIFSRKDRFNIPPNKVGDVGGIDLIQEVFAKNEKTNEYDMKIGTIAWEFKNHNKWSAPEYTKFVEKVKINSWDINIFLTREAIIKDTRNNKYYEKISDDLIYDSLNNIYIVTYSSYKELVIGLRQQLIKYKPLLSEKKIDTVSEHLYEYIKSSKFKEHKLIMISLFEKQERVISNLEKNTKDIKKNNDNAWEKFVEMYDQVISYLK